MYLGENNGNLRETVSNSVTNFYLVEILSEPNSLTIVTREKILKMSNYVLIFSISFLIMRIRNLQCVLWSKTQTQKRRKLTAF